MTYAEALKKSLDKFETSESKTMYPICFQQFLSGMAGLQVWLASTLWAQDFPDTGLSMMGEKIADFDGKAREPMAADFEQLMFGALTFSPRGMAFTTNWGQFVSWLLDEPIPESDDGMIIWYDADTLIKKWNEYAKITGGAKC